jgi:hypothetical protein
LGERWDALLLRERIGYRYQELTDLNGPRPPGGHPLEVLARLALVCLAAFPIAPPLLLQPAPGLISLSLLPPRSFRPYRLNLSASDVKLVGEEPDDAVGYSVSSAGDVNGDGYDDLIVGGPGHAAGGSGAGAAYLLLGHP